MVFGLSQNCPSIYLLHIGLNILVDLVSETVLNVVFHFSFIGSRPTNTGKYLKGVVKKWK